MKSRKAKLPTAISMDFKRTHAVNGKFTIMYEKGKVLRNKKHGPKGKCSREEYRKKFER